MIIVVGSRRNGNSQELAHLVQDMLNKERIYSKIIVPGNQKIHLCTGCMDCDKDGICDFKDDMEQNIEDIKNDRKSNSNHSVLLIYIVLSFDGVFLQLFPIL